MRQDFKAEEYQPEKYWDERARKSSGDLFKAVCIIEAQHIGNKLCDWQQQNILKKICNEIDFRDQRVLEFGCGVGRWINFFQQYGCDWHGVDISQEMLTELSKKISGDKIGKIRNCQIPFPDNYFDIIYSITVLHHNKFNDQDLYLKEIRRVLKSSGYFILFEDVKGKSFNMYPREREGWRHLGKRNGFTPIRDFSSGFGILLGIFNNRDLLQKIPKHFPDFTYNLSKFIDPRLVQLYPKRFANATAILFKKN